MTIRYVPVHVGGIPFEIGNAVLIAKHPLSFIRRIAPIPGIITSMGAQYATVQTAERRIRVMPIDLHHRGYCERCEVAATVDTTGALVCLQCGADASASVPIHRLPRWDRRIDMYMVHLTREMLTTGCTMGEAIGAVHKKQRDAWDAMMHQTGLIESYHRFDDVWFDAAVAQRYRDKMEDAAEQGDAGAFVELYREARGFLMYLRAASLIRLRDEMEADASDLPDRPEPPSGIVRPADDAQPDGEDDMTRWVQQQFRRAA
jgi:hypothetical protein